MGSERDQANARLVAHRCAREMMRLVLKDMGLDPRTIGKQEMIVCLKKALVDALQARGVPEPDKVCAQLRGALSKTELAAAPDSPQDIFRRLAGSSE